MHNNFYVQSATAEPLLQRLEGVQKSGNGWRAMCPACGGRSRKLSVAERESAVLLYCFGGCKAIEVLESVGLAWPDIMPPRHWPESPEERRQARRAIREAGWASALAVIATEATVALIAARQVATWKILSEDDDARLALAVQRIDHAAAVLVEARR
ncbi:hypothetical protein [Luteimonas sp. A501]